MTRLLPSFFSFSQRCFNLAQSQMTLISVDRCPDILKSPLKLSAEEEQRKETKSRPMVEFDLAAALATLSYLFDYLSFRRRQSHVVVGSARR